MKIQIEFDDVLSEVLTEEEMKEFILALVKYKQSKGIDDFSSRAIKVAYMLTTQHKVKPVAKVKRKQKKKSNPLLFCELEETNEYYIRKKRISEINRQNALKRWAKYKQNKESNND